MKEWLLKVAKELGMAADATEEAILAKLSEKLLSGGTAESRLSTVVAQLAAVGAKLDGDKIVKLAAPAPAADPVAAARIAELELDNAKSKLSAAKTTVDGLVAAGKVPPSLRAHLDKVFASTGKLESLQLGKGSDGSEVIIKGTVEILEELRALFNGLPSVLGNKLSTVGGQPKPGDKPAGSLGRSVAARAQGKKPAKEPAAS